MTRKYPSLSRQLGQASSAGVMLAACIFVGTAMGLLFDKWLGTKPWMMLLFMVLGIIAGFYNVVKIIKSLQNP